MPAQEGVIQSLSQLSKSESCGDAHARLKHCPLCEGKGTGAVVGVSSSPLTPRQEDAQFESFCCCK